MSLLLETSDLRYAYHGSDPCVDGASLTLDAGERLGLVGLERRRQKYFTAFAGRAL